VHATGGFTRTGREKIAEYLGVPAGTPAAPAEIAPRVDKVETTPVAATVAATVSLPSADAVDAAYKAGFAAAMATMANAAPVPAPVVETSEASTKATFTLPAYSVSSEAYGASVAAIAERLAGRKGVTVKRVARTGPDRCKFTVTGPASAHTVAAAYVAALALRAPVKA
jgi:hypothetical protein